MKANQTLTADLRHGDLSNTLAKLQGRDVSSDDFAAIGKDDALLGDVVEAILKHRLFASPKEQVLRLLEINEAVWKDPAITEEAINAAGDPPDCPPSDEHGLYCVTLLYETGDPLTTFERNWNALVHVHGENRTWKWDRLLFTPQGVRPRVGAMSRKLGIRWSIAELGRALKGICVRDVRSEMDKRLRVGMGQELLLIGAMHPKWAVSMDGNNIPFVDAPDLEVAPSARGEFRRAPCFGFSRGRGEVCLYANDVGVPDSVYGSGSLLG